MHSLHPKEHSGRFSQDYRDDATFCAMEGSLKMTSIGVLVVDDFEPWRRFVSSTLKQQLHLAGLIEVSDGLDAVQTALELQPGLIVLDIGLPRLSGIDAAHQIRSLVPNAKIIFLTENRDPALAEAALRTGATGYVVKSDAGQELLTAVEAVMAGKQFVSDRLRGSVHDFEFAQRQVAD
jgi:DNA-binding NarL/FixJ family response regulator